MTASNFGNLRGDGRTGQIENISMGSAQDGYLYTGRVHYYSGEVGADARFSVIISGTGDDGLLTRFYQHDQGEYVKTGDGTLF